MRYYSHVLCTIFYRAFLINGSQIVFIVQLAGAVEYTYYFSAEGKTPQPVF